MRVPRGRAHPDLFDELEDFGGLAACPADVRRKIVRWMVLCYIGEPGGYGAGWNREVFYSNAAAGRIEQVFKAAGVLIRSDVEAAGDDGEVRSAMARGSAIARRYEELLDLTEASQ